jgi:hypothetical protein
MFNEVNRLLGTQTTFHGLSILYYLLVLYNKEYVIQKKPEAPG